MKKSVSISKCDLWYLATCVLLSVGVTLNLEGQNCRNNYLSGNPTLLQCFIHSSAVDVLSWNGHNLYYICTKHTCLVNTDEALPMRNAPMIHMMTLRLSKHKKPSYKWITDYMTADMSMWQSSEPKPHIQLNISTMTWQGLIPALRLWLYSGASVCHSGANRLQKWTQTPRTTTETASTFYSVYIRQQSVIRRGGRGWRSDVAVGQ